MMFASKTPEMLRGAEPTQTCPYYFGAGSCNQGCWEEPRCITDEPRTGWGYLPTQHNEASDVLVRVRTAGLPIEHWQVAVAALEAFGGYTQWNDPAHPFHVLTVASSEQLAHAVEVISRLA